jgi:hypothetical protein
MNLNPAQVAEKLGVTRTRIHTLIRNGLLVDVKPRTPGAKKHFPLIDSKQLQEYIKEHGKPNGRFRGLPLQKRSEPTAVDSFPEPVAAKPLGFKSQLDRIEAKLDTLLKIWS